jgi:hypothetical protein
MFRAEYKILILWNQNGFTSKTSRTASPKKNRYSIKLTSTKQQMNPKQFDKLIPKLGSQLLSKPLNAFGNPRLIYYSIVI